MRNFAQHLISEAPRPESARMAFGNKDSIFNQIFLNPFGQIHSSLGVPQYPIIIETNLMKKIMKVPTQVNIHITNVESLERGNLVARQRKDSPLSASRSVPTGDVLLGGIEHVGGVAAILRGEVILAGYSDIYTMVDFTGRRWIMPGNLIEVYGASLIPTVYRGAIFVGMQMVMQNVSNDIGKEVERKIHPYVKRMLDRLDKKHDADQERRTSYHVHIGIAKTKVMTSMNDAAFRNTFSYNLSGLMVKIKEIDPQFSHEMEGQLVKIYIAIVRDIMKKHANSFEDAFSIQKITDSISPQASVVAEFVMTNFEILELHHFYIGKEHDNQAKKANDILRKLNLHFKTYYVSASDGYDYDKESMAEARTNFIKRLNEFRGAYE